MPNIPMIAHLSADRFQVAFSAAFGDCVGTYDGDGKMTLAEVSAATGIKPRNLEAYRDGETMPRGFGLFQLMEVLPERFTNRLLGEISMGGSRKMSPEEIDQHMIVCDAANYTKMFVDHMADGRIDHIEEIEAVKAGRRMYENLGRWLLSVDAPKESVKGKGKGKGGAKISTLPNRAGAA
ncbi:hypothetical protein [Paremcibacter congregatus]|uniref:hypothetical protein n=1 Tax=Paremcibacter congregatus TaxID=2043170 RepID=UPI003A8D418A